MVVSGHGVGTWLSGAAGMTGAITFVVIAAILCAAAVLVILGTAQVYLSGPEALEHDGLARGQRAPAWALADASGLRHTSPPSKPLQLVVFADHSLKSFPSVLDGLRELIAADPALETVVLLRQRNELAGPLLAMLGLDGVPVLTGTPALYADYKQWAADGGERSPMTSTAFGTKLADRGFSKVHSERGAVYVGIGLRSHDEQPRG